MGVVLLKNAPFADRDILWEPISPENDFSGNTHSNRSTRMDVGYKRLAFGLKMAVQFWDIGSEVKIWLGHFSVFQVFFLKPNIRFSSYDNRLKIDINTDRLNAIRTLSIDYKWSFDVLKKVLLSPFRNACLGQMRTNLHGVDWFWKRHWPPTNRGIHEKDSMQVTNTQTNKHTHKQTHIPKPNFMKSMGHLSKAITFEWIVRFRSVRHRWKALTK